MSLFSKFGIGKEKHNNKEAYDIFSIWNHLAYAVHNHGKPVNDNQIYAVIISNLYNAEDTAIQALKNSGVSNPETLTYQLSNMADILYFTTIRNNYDLCLISQNVSPQILKNEILQESTPVIDWLSSIGAYTIGSIDAQTFLNGVKDQQVFYTTPMGNDKSGKQKLYILGKEGLDYRLLPVFITESHMHEFYKYLDGYMVLTGKFSDFISPLDSNSMLSSLGIVIEPLYSCSAIIPPHVRPKTDLS
jgi:hypothetical protein